MYNISYTGQLFDTTTQYIYVSTSNVYPAVDPVYLNITGLEEYNNYTISVSAFNTVGASDFTPEVVQITNIAGNYPIYTTLEKRGVQKLFSGLFIRSSHHCLSSSINATQYHYHFTWN